MTLPICPNCRSPRIQTGYPLDAGTNKCEACGYTGAVAGFHDVSSLPLIVRKKPIEPGPSQLDLDRMRYAPKPHHEPKVREITRKLWWME